MTSDLYPTLGVVNGINLANYFPYERSYGSVLYVHKKFLQNKQEEGAPQKLKETNTKNEQSKVEKEKKKKKKKKRKGMLDKSIQFNNELVANNWKDNNTYKVRRSNDSVMEQTIKFAKNIVPLVIPPSRDVSPPPVFYTIKATKSKKKSREPRNVSEQKHDMTYKKEKTKKVVETYRNERVSQRESISVKETISFSSENNTLDELQFNPSLCCSLSEISDKKHVKKQEGKPKQNDLLKFTVSESFDALATELINQSGDAKVKIHLMNETDKYLFSENIRVPVINAIKECLSELNSENNINNGLVTVQRHIKCNTQKLDNVLDRLTNIEKKLDNLNHKSMKAKSPKNYEAKSSTLEVIEKDLIEIQENSSEEDFRQVLLERKRARGKSTVVQVTPKCNEKMLNSDKTGDIGIEQETSEPAMGAKKPLGARPNRVPARFCWTESGKE